MMSWWYRMIYWWHMNELPVSPDFILISPTSSVVRKVHVSMSARPEQKMRHWSTFFCGSDKWSKTAQVNSTQEWTEAVWNCNPRCERSIKHTLIFEISEFPRMYYLISFVFWLDLCIAALVLFSHWREDWKLHAPVNELSLKDTLCPCDI